MSRGSARGHRHEASAARSWGFGWKSCCFSPGSSATAQAKCAASTLGIRAAPQMAPQKKKNQCKFFGRKRKKKKKPTSKQDGANTSTPPPPPDPPRGAGSLIGRDVAAGDVSCHRSDGSSQMEREFCSPVAPAWPPARAHAGAAAARAGLLSPSHSDFPPARRGVRVSIAPRETPAPSPPTQAGCSAPRGCSGAPQERFLYPPRVRGAGAGVMLAEREGGEGACCGSSGARGWDS